MRFSTAIKIVRVPPFCGRPAYAFRHVPYTPRCGRPPRPAVGACVGVPAAVGVPVRVPICHGTPTAPPSAPVKADPLGFAGGAFDGRGAIKENRELRVGPLLGPL